MAGLYIHIPFCHSKCSYCDFYSMPRTGDIGKYVDALVTEWRMRQYEIHEPFTTIYIGGGTPSILPPYDLKRLVSGIGISNPVEFTVEANPEDVTPEWVACIKECGVNRVSIGIQSFSDDELNRINRRHTGDEAENALETLREGGIGNISADLIYGLPGQTIDSWQLSLDRLVATGVEHISAYSLSYEPGTRLHAMLSTGKIKETDEDTVSEMYRRLTDSLRKAGYEHYEISNFALPDRRAIHNSSYWHFIPYLGLGTAAHSFDGKTRRANRRGIKAYISDIMSGKTFYDIEDENPDELYNDYIITSLRTAEGIDKRHFAGCFGDKAFTDLRRDASAFLRSGKMTETPDSLFITEESFLISDSILVELIH